MSPLAFDEPTAQRLEVLYRARDVLRRRRLVRAALDPRVGEQLLDIGCGPGFYVAELLGDVGPTGSVVGIDRSPEMLAIAARRCAGLGNVVFFESDATALPVPDEAFDGALSVQVLEYVADVDTALREIGRVLRPGARLVVWDVDWSTVSWYSTDPGRMQHVLSAWDAHLAHPALPRTLAPRLRAAGFTDIVTEGHAFVAEELTPDAYGPAIIPFIRDFVPGHGGVTTEEADVWAQEQEDLHAAGSFFFACIQFCFRAVRDG